MDHVDEVFRVTVDMIRDSSNFSSSRKNVVGAAVGDVVECVPEIPAHIPHIPQRGEWCLINVMAIRTIGLLLFYLVQNLFLYRTQ